MLLKNYHVFSLFSRSLCSTVCKWTYKCDGVSQEWDRGFFKDVGLEDLAEDGWRKIGRFYEIVNLALEECYL